QLRGRGSAKEDEECCTSIAVKGHCVMYTANGRHFEVPLVYQELLRMSQKDWLCKRWQDHIAL
uniref:Uncharacterized protein n=1 Tax=Aegilops tauschii subsp. strangulata TaxID=200361 RepID=A0A453LJ04_AEGTS